MKGTAARLFAPVLACLFAFFSVHGIAAAPDPAGASGRVSGISLITILPGDSLYSAFGHTAIRVVDPRNGSDVLYNYGLSAHAFDLRFGLNMFVGRMEFLAAPLRSAESFDFYRADEDRTIIEQTLNLDAAQASALLAKLKRDVRPENRIYNYRYFTDNCATRVWDLLAPLIAEGTGGAVGPKDLTLRKSLMQASAGKAWLATILNLFLGPRADAPTPATASLFLPRQIMDRLEPASVAGRDSEPLVLKTEVLYQSTKADPSGQGFQPWMLSGLLFALSLLPLLFPAAKLATVFDAILFGAAAFLCLPLLMFWLSAGYGEASSNLNLVWANPLPLLALVAAGRKSWRRLAGIVFYVAAGLCGLYAVSGGLGIQVLQPEFRILALAIAVRSAARGYRALSSLRTGRSAPKVKATIAS